MSNGKPEPAYCPNCTAPALKEGNKITCEKCDAVFAITRAGSAKVVDLNIMQRVKQLEDEVATLKGNKQPADQQPKQENEDEI